MRIKLGELKKIIKEEAEGETFGLADLQARDLPAFEAYVQTSDVEFWYDEGVLMTSDGEVDYAFEDGEWQAVEYEE